MEIGFPELAAIRLGYGLGDQYAPPVNADAVMASLALAGPGPDAVSTNDAVLQRHRWQTARNAAETGGKAKSEKVRRMRANFALQRFGDLQRRLVRGLSDPVGFGERMVQFWADHFTVRSKNIVDNLLISAFVDEAIRPHLSSRFEDMLFAAATHPAMLVYLDQVSSSGPGSVYARRRAKRGAGLNENLARETIELHTLGAGAKYAQKDVRQLAELLTGLTFGTGRPGRFRPEMAEPGAEVVLGRKYGGPGTDGVDEIQRALTDLARHPATARHLSRKLAVHFLTDTPDDEMVEHLAAVWRETQGDLMAVSRALVDHPALAATFRQKARQPFDFIVAALRTLGVAPIVVAGMDNKAVRRIAGAPLARMGQDWGQQIGPDGWPEMAASWITPQALAARIDWSLRLPRQLIDPLPDPRDLMASALGTTASEALRWAVPRAESVPEGVAIVLSSTDFNRR